MPCSMIEAHDQILALLRAALPVDLAVKYPDIATAPGFPPASASWARVSISDTDEDEPPTLVSSPGNRRTKTAGLLTVELYTLAGDGRQACQALGLGILAAFRGQSTLGGVVFRRERINDVGADGAWYHINAIIEFTYSTIQ